MVARNKSESFRTVFVGFLAVLTVQCAHGNTVTAQTRTTSPTQTPTQTDADTQTMYSTVVVDSTVIIITDSSVDVCNSTLKCSGEKQYCKMENQSDSGICEPCHDSCETCSGPGTMDCTKCDLDSTSFIVQHVVYDSETTTPTGTSAQMQTTTETTEAQTTTRMMTTHLASTFRTIFTSRSTDVTTAMTSSSTSRSPDVTTTMTSSSTHPNASPTAATTERPHPNYSIKLECVADQQCPGNLKLPFLKSKICCHAECEGKGCYGSSHSNCCHGNCKNSCYGDGSGQCCPTNCDPKYGCYHDGDSVKCRMPLKNEPPKLTALHYGLIGTGGGIVLMVVGIVSVFCCIRRRGSARPQEESDGGEENIEMRKKKRSKKRKRNSYVPGPNSVRELNQEGPYANEEYTDPSGLANSAHQPDDAYDDVNVDPDSVYVEPQPDQFNNPESTADDIYDQPPPEELNRHQGATNYGYHDDGPVYGNDPDQVSGEQYPVSGEQYPVSGQAYPVSGEQYPVYGNDPDQVSGEQYPVSTEQYPVSGEQYPVSGEHYPVSTDQSGFAPADEPVYQNYNPNAPQQQQDDLPIYENQNFSESNPQPLEHQDVPVYYDYSAQHNPDATESRFPPPPQDYDDEEQFRSLDSMPSLPPPQPPEDLPNLPHHRPLRRTCSMRRRKYPLHSLLCPSAVCETHNTAPARQREEEDEKRAAAAPGRAPAGVRKESTETPTGCQKTTRTGTGCVWVRERPGPSLRLRQLVKKTPPNVNSHVCNVRHKRKDSVRTECTMRNYYVYFSIETLGMFL
ncbi:uncharacterized protein LOC144907771 [Branchiostoma floridae x Branchiostoma belcheri]